MFQPIVRLATGETTGAEALLRWNTPETSFASPLEFISDAESNGAIVQVGTWVVAHALSVAAHWPERVSVSVNVSGRELQHRGYARMVQDSCSEWGYDPAQLHVEVTESFFAVSGTIAQKNLRTLREQGVKIAIDDFGAGASDLRRLAELDADIIKIDRSCIAQLNSHHGADLDDLERLIDSALDAQRVIIAEGVESHEQRSWLVNKGCELAQGFLYSKPVDARAFLGNLESPLDVA